MERLTSQISPTFESMVAAVSSFSDAEFNAVPFAKSWTGGQVAEHVKLSIEGIPELFAAETAASDRDPEEKIEMVAGVFLDFDKKYESPESIVPEEKTYDRQDYLKFYKDFLRTLGELAANLDMSRICLGFEIPGFGPMTRLEFLSFVLFHTQRHVRQMENIRKALN
ncbi:DinB family protein [Flavobacterium selenitireducens]|uniref:DinB family protein n=1 Tax=Flavobacterium selenitireducens TaxID=2722704 RepID=UPI00168A8B3A|nr:DinB family protein [Flavobacterium selenitireducens]MBD3583709.1 DinB family protein [Flavobacterium selenitireducens]